MCDIMCPDIDLHIGVVLVERPDCPIIGSWRVQSDDRTPCMRSAHRVQDG